MTPRTVRAALIVGLALCAAPIAARAQLSGNAVACAGATPVVADACQKARDLFAFAAPQVAVALAGGDAVLGDGSTLGGLGKASLAVRATGLFGAIPRNGSINVSAGGARASDIATQSRLIPAATIEGAVGVLPGLLVGLTRVGGVDVLFNATYVPETRVGTFDLSNDGRSSEFGYGVRVGLLQESSVVPGVAFTWVRRRLPTSRVGLIDGNDTLTVRSLALSADAWRAVVSKRFLMLGLAAGIGQDAVDAQAIVSAVVNDGGRRYALSDVILGDTPRRTNAFLDASFGLGGIRLVGEVGRSFAASPRDVLNAFGGRTPGGAFNYASVGLRLGN
ncbi:MAG: hypothetical protein MUF00_07065 [Gemmatimonadaceae bacterium]|jgi:hypothetical protein|nr:hypothetical protein [Gemmatimonadaceae bacterium]